MVSRWIRCRNNKKKTNAAKEDLNNRICLYY